MTRDSLPAEASPILWRKSSYSGPQGGNCVEVATARGHVLVRDSTHPRGARLSVAGGTWAAFLAAVRAGEFDLG